MALIPITFKADDVDNEKKGSVQGQDLASFLAMGTSKSAGILDVLGSNACSIIGNPTISTGTATLTFNAGYIVIYGRLIYIEQGTKVQFELPTSSRVSGSLGIRVSLADAGAMECSWFTKTDQLRKDNLLHNMSTGIYEFRLYDYTATPTGFAVRNKTSEKILNIKDYFEGANFVTMPIDNSTKHLATTEFVHKIIKNATKMYETNIIRISDNSVAGKLYKFGRYVMGYINSSVNTTKGSSRIAKDYFSFDKSFAPQQYYNTLQYGCITNEASATVSGEGAFNHRRAYIGNLVIRSNGTISGLEYCSKNAIQTEIPICITFGYDMKRKNGYREPF